MNWDYLKNIEMILSGLNECSVAFRIILAALTGGCIGSDRGRHGHAAGMRTHILVSVGAAMTVLAGLYTAMELGFSNDPLRLGAQVVSGIGFLGAGTILTRNKTQITGLTTAAGLWTTASIGIAIGVGFYWAVIVAFVVVLIVITTLTKLEKNSQNRSGKSYYLELDDVRKVNEFCDQFSEKEVKVQIVSAKSGMKTYVGLMCFVPKTVSDAGWMQELRNEEHVVIVVPV